MKRIAIATGVVFLAAGAARADLVFTLDNAYTGSSPAGTAPWLTATFAQTGVDSVRLTLQSNLTGSEFISRLLFNVEPGQAVSGVFNSGLSSGMFGAPGISFGDNSFVAGAGARYDAQVNFIVGPPAQRFGEGDVAVFDLTGLGLTESSFDFFGEPAGNGLAFKMAAHVQGIGPGGQDSGWIGGEIIPLPPAVWTGLACLGGVIGMTWLKRRSKMAD
jgi:hypothetical protein